MVNLLLAVIYMAFISLGLPDSLLGAAWPTMYGELSVPVSFAGGISMIISLGTIFSSLQSDRLTRRFGTGRVTAFSVLMTAAALFGFSLSRSYIALCLIAIPYGLGAGSVDASLNNYVALHYASRHMSWLHCMWGLGASMGPYFMGYALSSGAGWRMGYRYISIIQMVLTAILMLSLPLWSRQKGIQAPSSASAAEKPLSVREIVRIPGAIEIMAAFFCYCALESTTGLWASSYLVLSRGFSPETAASLASLFYVDITAGRAVSGFLTMRFSDTEMIRLGQCFMLLGALLVVIPAGFASSVVGFVVIGLGCAPVYPSIIHSTPAHFGVERSQAMIGVQMATAYIGGCIMPPVFGLLANGISVDLLPFFLLAILIIMIAMHESLVRKAR